MVSFQGVRGVLQWTQHPVWVRVTRWHFVQVVSRVGADFFGLDAGLSFVGVSGFLEACFFVGSGRAMRRAASLPVTNLRTPFRDRAMISSPSVG